MNADISDQMSQILCKVSQVIERQNEFERSFGPAKLDNVLTSVAIGKTVASNSETTSSQSSNRESHSLDETCDSKTVEKNVCLPDSEAAKNLIRPAVADVSSASVSEEVVSQQKHGTGQLNSDLPRQEELLHLSSLVNELKLAVSDLYRTIYQHELHLDRLEQYSRSNCLILHGCDADLKSMNNCQVEDYVLDVLNNDMNLPVEICDYEIDICHPLPSNKKKNPIIIKFVRRSIRNLVFSHKKYLKFAEGRRLSITESLTKRRLNLVNEARKVFRFENVWSMKGEVFVKFKGKKHHLYDFCDIQRIRFPESCSP